MEDALSAWEEETKMIGRPLNDTTRRKAEPLEDLVEESADDDDWIPSSWQDELDAEATARNVTDPEERRQLKACAYNRGYWYYDTKRPAYSSRCQWIRTAFNCLQNGRKDKRYLYWSWRPSGCNMPKFDVIPFCHKLQGKLIVFIGDSFAENFYEALACRLDAHVFVKRYVAHIAGTRIVGITVHKYKIRILFLSAPYLVKYSNKAADFKPYGIQPRSVTDYIVWLDKMDPKWAAIIKYVDLSIWLSGHWFQVTLGTQTVRARNFVRNNKLLRNYPGQSAYKIALRNVNSYLKHTVNYKGIPVYGTYSPSHYTIAHGKTPFCRATQPSTFATTARFYKKDSSTSWHNIEAAMLANSRFRLLDVTFLLDGRPDGHIETYYGNSRSSTTFDCTHWCLPGVPDIWVDAFHYVLRTQVF
eukprot:TRINITY_DN4143_c0_g1_i1.p1 TRINITY_DN4143_c0_g1~~TRINITY_DN4143_c0_g1_i1.p1  ORF type:complete len:460 (+),score=31.94 TRINITY_DN4143_c0_g1_i1:138-1382(+)